VTYFATVVTAVLRNNNKCDERGRKNKGIMVKQLGTEHHEGSTEVLGEDC